MLFSHIHFISGIPAYIYILFAYLMFRIMNEQKITISLRFNLHLIREILFLPYTMSQS